MMHSDAQSKYLFQFPCVFGLPVALMLFLAAVPVWSVEPDYTALTRDGRTIREVQQSQFAEPSFVSGPNQSDSVQNPGVSRRVQHIFSPRSWAPRGYHDHADASDASPHPEVHAERAATQRQADDVHALRNWMGRHARSDALAAVVTKAAEPAVNAPKKRLWSSHPKHRNRALVAVPKSDSRGARVSEKQAGKAARGDESGASQPPQHRSPTRW